MPKVDREKARYLYQELEHTHLEEGELVANLPNIEYMEVLMEALGEVLRKRHNLPFYGDQKKVKLHYAGNKSIEFKVKNLLAREGYIGPILDVNVTLLSWKEVETEKIYKTIETLGALEIIATAVLSSTVENEQIAIAVLLTIRREDENKLVAIADFRLIMDAEVITHHVRLHKWDALKTIILSLGYPVEGGAIGGGKKG